MLRARYITQRAAKDWIDQTHRHHRAPRDDIYRVAAESGGVLVGVVCVGRPVSRVLDDGETVEVLRLATDGTQNVCSFLYGRAARIAKEMGFSSIITYTLPSEGGASLRATGWECEGEAGGGTWFTPSRPRVDQHPTETKLRWRKRFANNN